MAKKIVKRKIEATRTEWELAIHRWNLERRSGYDTALSPRQLGLLNELEKNPKALNGEPVLIIKSADGGYWSSYPYKGMILKANYVGNKYILTVLYHPIEGEDWIGERIETVELYQVEQVRDLYQPKATQLKDIKFLNVLALLNKSRQRAALEQQRVARDLEASIRSMQKDIARYEEKLKYTQTLIEKNRVADLTKEEMLGFFRQIGKNKKVDNAYVTLGGEMIVETKMLYATTPVQLKVNKDKPIGRMVFKLSSQGISYCSFANLDYCYHPDGNTRNGHYPHPNVSGNAVCYGDNGTLLEGMARNAQWYELIDFLILFFSLFPHDTGTPHIPHDRWMDHKVIEPKTNPFATSEKLWELHPKRKVKLTDAELKKKIAEEAMRDLKGFAEGMVVPRGTHIAQILGAAIDNQAREMNVDAGRYYMAGAGGRGMVESPNMEVLDPIPTPEITVDYVGNEAEEDSEI